MSKYDVILDVYENQSISKAAAKHNYTQSAVSQTIRNYEMNVSGRLQPISTIWTAVLYASVRFKVLLITGFPAY